MFFISNRMQKMAGATYLRSIWVKFLFMINGGENGHTGNRYRVFSINSKLSKVLFLSCVKQASNVVLFEIYGTTGLINHIESID